MPIAIVGLAAQLGPCSDLEEFWRLLDAGEHSISDRPPQRAELAHAPADVPTMGSFLPSVDRFDATFFGISPREAAVLDPQQRLMLETVWRALEDSATRAADLRGSRTGVWMGGLWHDYELLRHRAGEPATPHSIVGNSLDIVSARVSYFLGLNGPSLTVESSCSSSLVAVHLACQSLARGECADALVGGSNLILTPETSEGLTRFGGLSPTGLCRAFGAGADGFVRGEGVAAVHLKTLAAALRDGDRIRAVIRASAVNNDGGGASLVTPNPAAQAQLLRDVYDGHGIPKREVMYVEAHGTGTRRGDPAEAGALGQVLGRPGTDSPLLIGSVKSNIGHLEPAAGLAGLIKVVLAIGHGRIPASLHAEQLNPDIDFAALGVTVARTAVPLPAEGPAYFGVNSFGWGGTNAHVVLTGPPAAAAEPEPRTTDLPARVLLSGHTAAALTERVTDTAALLGRLRSAADVADLADALAWRRDQFAERLALVVPPELVGADLTADLAELLAAGDEPAADAVGARGTVLSRGRAAPVGTVAFVFPGQGSQWPGMAAGVYGRDEAFTDSLDRCAEALRSELDWDLREDVCDPRRQAWLDRVDRVQPALWAMSVSLAAAWRAAGVHPDVVVGHSQGEIAAATVAGILSLTDGAAVVARRSTLLRSIAGHGRMLAVELDGDAAVEALQGFEELVSIAVDNGTGSTVLSGDTDSVLLLKEILGAEDVFCRLVDVDYASHSPQVDPLLPGIRSALSGLAPRRAEVPMLSTVTLSRPDGPELDAAYWARNLRQPVRFGDAMATLTDDGLTHVLEMSAHPVLAGVLGRMPVRGARPVSVLPTLRRDAGTATDLGAAFARAWVAGLGALGARPARRPVVCPPPYPFQRESYWVPPQPAAGRVVTSDLATLPTAVAGVSQAVLTTGLAAHPWLADHRVGGLPVFPAGGHIGVALAAAATGAEAAPALRDVVFAEPLAVETDGTDLAVTCRPDAGLSIASLGREGGVAARTELCRAIVATPSDQLTGTPETPDGLDPMPVEAFYADCAARGLDYGPAFRSVRSVRRRAGAAVVSVAVPEGVAAFPGVLHPVLWDGVLQAALAADPDGDAEVPAAIDEVALRPGAAPVRELIVYAWRTEPRHFRLLATDDNGQIVARVGGLRLAPLSGGAPRAVDGVYGLELEPVELAPAQDGRVANRTVLCGPYPSELVQALAAAMPEATVRVAEDRADAWLEHADHAVFVAPDRSAGADRQRDGLLSLSRLIAALATAGRTALTVVTRDALPTPGGDRVDPGAAMVTGLVAVAQNEHPHLGLRLIDVDAAPDPAALRAELLHGDADDLVALRGTARFAGRRRAGRGPAVEPARLVSAAPQPFRVVAEVPGRIDTVTRQLAPPAEPGPGRLTIAVSAASLNFIDVLKVLGAYPDSADDAALLGLDCAGTVTAVGAGVTDVAVGDRVIGCGPAALASHVEIDARLARPVPAGMSEADAAALPMVYVTAWHALIDVARIRPGETVLIHSAAGGFGLAALHVARLRGGVVLATAGNEDKRELLRGLGVTHVFDSRGTDWADEVRRVAPQGVDVVLNSLAGRGIGLGLEVLADDGRFVELGKRDIHGGAALELAPFAKAVTLSAVDVAGLLRRRPDRIAAVLAEVWAEITAGRLPTLPVTEYGFDEVDLAFRAMSTGRHTGKLVVVDPALGAGTVAPRPSADGRFDADRTYLITGGLGALGLSAAEFLAERGARHLALVGRSAPSTQAAARLDGLREQGCHVEVFGADVGDEQELAAVLARVRASMPPLCGVLHAAGVLRDATIASLNGDELRAVFAGKADGAAHLDRLTRDDAIELFVLFSSVAAYVGSPGQAAYAAANAYLDGLAYARRHEGLAALSVQWGPVRDVGLAAAASVRGDRLGDRGLDGISVAECWPALTRFLQNGEAVVARATLDVRRWVDSYPATASLASWRPLLEQRQDAAAAGHMAVGALRGLDDAALRHEVEGIVRTAAASVLRIQSTHLESDIPLKSLGLDSLMSLELRNLLESRVGLRLSPTLLWKFTTVGELGTALTGMLGDARTGERSDRG
ncbi:type I polyketide synthase [Micromonospora sp. DT53]|uniref:type I polyketide synthase n=1 Tax=Micromonospora sp. DT53 TaxID=3393444 RepID=UPI003CF71711